MLTIIKYQENIGIYYYNYRFTYFADKLNSTLDIGTRGRPGPGPNCPTPCIMASFSILFLKKNTNTKFTLMN